MQATLHVMQVNHDVMPLHQTRRAFLLGSVAAIAGGCRDTASPNSPPTSPMRSRIQSIDNHILFPGNPWPNGHAIKDFRWSAELRKGARIWCHLHLKSEAYGASDLDQDEPASENTSNWQSKNVWNNYGSCTLSSTQWDHSGFVVGTPEEPFDLDSMSGYTFEVDSMPFNVEDQPSFGIYCQGHDTVAGHQISFLKDDAGWAIDWSARIALTYLGGQEFDHRLIARKTGVHFDGIALSHELAPEDAVEVLSQCVMNSSRYTLETTEFESHFRIR